MEEDEARGLRGEGGKPGEAALRAAGTGHEGGAGRAWAMATFPSLEVLQHYIPSSGAIPRVGSRDPLSRVSGLLSQAGRREAGGGVCHRRLAG